MKIEHAVAILVVSAACSTGALPVGSDRDGGGEADGGTVLEGGVTDGAAGGPDAGGPDGSTCTPLPVWSAADQGFTYFSLGGDATCGARMTYTNATKVLENSCAAAGTTTHTVTLTSAQATDLESRLVALRTSCPPYLAPPPYASDAAVPRCIADVSNQSLEVRSAAASTTYGDDARAGCTPSPPSSPVVDFQALDDLWSLLFTLDP